MLKRQNLHRHRFDRRGQSVDIFGHDSAAKHSEWQESPSFVEPAGLSFGAVLAALALNDFLATRRDCRAPPR
jgi:hypothetical protein